MYRKGRGVIPGPFPLGPDAVKITSGQQPEFEQGLPRGSLLALRDNWRCFLWLPSDRREALIALTMFAIFLGLMPFGTKIGLAKADIVATGIDYKPVAAIVLTLLLSAGNILRTQALAVGDYLCDARLLKVTLATWLTLSVVTFAVSVVAAAVPTLSPLEEPGLFNLVVAFVLASQIPLALTLAASFIFKPSTSGANDARASNLGARAALASLWRRRQPGRHKEEGNDSADWDRLLGYLKAIISSGELLPLRLKCPDEADHAGRLVGNARRLSDEINSQILPLRNKLLDAELGSPDTAARDFFLT
jgi:hypothetical protein